MANCFKLLLIILVILVFLWWVQPSYIFLCALPFVSNYFFFKWLPHLSSCNGRKTVQKLGLVDLSNLLYYVIPFLVKLSCPVWFIYSLILNILRLLRESRHSYTLTLLSIPLFPLTFVESKYKINENRFWKKFWIHISFFIMYFFNW